MVQVCTIPFWGMPTWRDPGREGRGEAEEEKGRERERGGGGEGGIVRATGNPHGNPIERKRERGKKREGNPNANLTSREG